MTIERKRLRTQPLFRFLVLVLSMYFVMITFFVVAGTYKTGNDLLEPTVLIDKAFMNIKSEQAKNDNFTKEIVKECVDEIYMKQPNCVIREVRPYFNYTIKTERMITPSEYKQKGGSCSDTTILYASVFKLLEWDIQYVFPNENHVYIIVSKKIPCLEATDKMCNFFCDIDGDNSVCKLSV